MAHKHTYFLVHHGHVVLEEVPDWLHFLPLSVHPQTHPWTPDNPDERRSSPLHALEYYSANTEIHKRGLKKIINKWAVKKCVAFITH